VSSAGLKTAIEGDYAEINICGRPCTMLDSLSTSSSVVCELPTHTHIATHKSLQTTKFTELEGTNIGDTPA